MQEYYYCEDFRNYSTGTDRPNLRLFREPVHAGNYQHTVDIIVDELPLPIRARVWIGAVWAWLDHPYFGEEECFSDALDELLRIRGEVE